MTPEQFCYWLQGFGELSGAPPTDEQWKSINEHLALVFKKVTPAYEHKPGGEYVRWAAEMARGVEIQRAARPPSELTVTC